MTLLLIVFLIIGVAFWLSRLRANGRSLIRATASPPSEIISKAAELNDHLFKEKDANEMAFIDFETTGLDASYDRIIEVGVCIVPLGVVGTASGYSELANPGMPIPPRITELTGITNEMVRDHLPTSDVIGRFLDHIGSRPIAAYNAKFDMAFLRSEAARIGRTVPNESHCIMEYTKRKHPNLPRYRLSDVCVAFGIEVEPRDGLQEHRALYDTERATKLYLAVAQGAVPKFVAESRGTRKQLDCSQLNLYHDIRASAKEEFRKAKEAEARDMAAAIAGYKTALTLFTRAAATPIYTGESAGSGSGDIECLNRLTLCLCKLNNGSEALAATESYFAAFPRECELRVADQIRKRVGKATAKEKSQGCAG